MIWGYWGCGDRGRSGFEAVLLEEGLVEGKIELEKMIGLLGRVSAYGRAGGLIG